MTATRDVDVLAVGCGPFNLGLVALGSRIDSLELAAYEASPELRWHPGLMFDDAVLQLSFLADLVTLVDPTHPLSFLAYLRDRDRLYPFFIREAFHPTRCEYEDYLRWAASKLPNIHFGHRVERVAWDAAASRFAVQVRSEAGARSVRARHLVLGIGTEPWTPAALSPLPRRALLHSAEYLHRRDEVLRARQVTVVGSGQSAAEVVRDLLRQNLEGGPGLRWLTRTRSFAPLDYSQLVLEMTTPAYVRYFHGLPQAVKDRLNAEQWRHYKGISAETIEDIYALLYERELKSGLAPVELRCGVAVEGAAASPDGRIALQVRDGDLGQAQTHRTDLVIAATGYRERRPTFLAPLEPLVRRDAEGRYQVRLDHSVELDPSVSGRLFVVNAELHSHGVATPDLGVGAYRNATILNAIVGREVLPLPKRTAFTSFGAQEAERAPARRPRSAPAPVPRSAERAG